MTLYHVSNIQRPVLHNKPTMFLSLALLQGPAEPARETSSVAELDVRTDPYVVWDGLMKFSSHEYSWLSACR